MIAAKRSNCIKVDVQMPQHPQRPQCPVTSPLASGSSHKAVLPANCVIPGRRDYLFHTFNQGNWITRVDTFDKRSLAAGLQSPLIRFLGLQLSGGLTIERVWGTCATAAAHAYCRVWRRPTTRQPTPTNLSKCGNCLEEDWRPGLPSCAPRSWPVFLGTLLCLTLIVHLCVWPCLTLLDPKHKLSFDTKWQLQWR